ncbi:hypothetical protein RUND412_000854 [Rhizina undulata]
MQKMPRGHTSTSRISKRPKKNSQKSQSQKHQDSLLTAQLDKMFVAKGFLPVKTEKVKGKVEDGVGDKMMTGEKSEAGGVDAELLRQLEGMADLSTP